VTLATGILHQASLIVHKCDNPGSCSEEAFSLWVVSWPLPLRVLNTTISRLVPFLLVLWIFHHFPKLFPLCHSSPAFTILPCRFYFHEASPGPFPDVKIFCFSITLLNRSGNLFACRSGRWHRRPHPSPASPSISGPSISPVLLSSPLLPSTITSCPSFATSPQAHDFMRRNLLSADVG